MKKMLLSVLCLIAIIFSVQGQSPEPVNFQKDKMEFQSYTIRLLPAQGHGYGYDILKGKEVLVHQIYNPFTLSPLGLSKKEDVYKVAQWQIKQLAQQNAPANNVLQSDKPSSALSIQKRLASTTTGDPRQQQKQRRPIVNQSLSKAVAQELQIDIH